MSTWADWSASNKDAQQAAKATVNKRQGTPPIWRLRQDLRWRPQADPGAGQRHPNVAAIEYDPIRMRFVMQEDGPWTHLMGKWVWDGKRNRFVISNSWNNQKPVPCLLWYACVSEGDEEEKQRFFADDMYALEVELLEDFHVEQVPMKKQGRFYENWHRCEGVDEDGKSLCKRCDDEGETVFGRKVFVLFFDRSKKQFEEMIETKGDACAGCQEGTINVYGYVCSNEACDHVFGHKKNGPEYTEHEAKAWEENEVKCPKCKEEDWPTPLFRCLHRKGYGKNRKWVAGCDEPIYENPWAYTYLIKTTKAGRSDSYAIEGFEFIEDGDLPELTGIPAALRELDMEELLGRIDLKSQKFALNLDSTPFDLDDAQQVLDRFFAADADVEDADSIPIEDGDMPDIDDPTPY
jgi:hypothetical protein